MNRDFLKEAIADAKAVKESAIANAKVALEEAFTPQLKSMLAAKLDEMETSDEDDVKEMRGSSYEEDDSMREEMRGKSMEDDTMEEEMKSMEDDTMREGKRAKNKETRKTEDERYGNDLAEAKEEMDEEVNLDEILAEIDNEISEDARTDAEEEGYEDGMEDEKEDMEDEEIDLDDMTDDDLKGFIEDVIADMVASGELEAGENFEEEGEEEMEMDTEVDVEVSEDKKKDKEDDKEKMEEQVGNPISTSVKAGAKNRYDEDFMKAVKDDLAKLMKKVGLKEEELDEAYSTIESLKSDLNEVNLLNAKLLYTNKIFKAKTLTESQKVKVLGAFDKAGTVKETKLVFETLNEGLKAKKKSPIVESLGSASRVSRSVNAKKPIIETDPMVERFKKLAGIK